MQVQSEGLHFAQKRINQQIDESFRAIGTKALAYNKEVILELLRRLISLVVRRRIASEAQAGRDEVQKVPIELRLGDALPARVFLAQGGLIFARPLDQRFGC